MHGKQNIKKNSYLRSVLLNGSLLSGTQTKVFALISTSHKRYVAQNPPISYAFILLS